MPQPPLMLTLTLDLFLGDWNRTGDLWVCIQPHIIDTTAGPDTFGNLMRWLNQDPHAGLPCDFTMAANLQNPSPAIAITPVPLPAATSATTNLAIDLMDGGPVLQLDRSTRLPIRNVSGIKLRNSNVPNPYEQNAPRPDPVTGTPYAQAYLAGFLELYAQRQPQPQECSHLLQLAFWGGSPVMFGPGDVDVPNDPGLMLLPATTASQTVTNLHSMTGHLIRLGNRHHDLARLNNVRQFTISLITGGATKSILVAPANGQDVQAFFGALADNDFDESQIKLAWSDKFARRAYARAALSSFAAQGYGKSSAAVTVYQRRVGTDFATLHGLTKLRRAIVGIGSAEAGAPPDPAWPASITLRPCRVIDGQLRRYRAAPGDAGHPTVLRFVAAPGEQPDLEAMLKADPQMFDGSNPRAQLIADSPQRPVYLGAWRFPWDHEGEINPQQLTLLFHGPEPASSASTILIEPDKGAWAFSAAAAPLQAASPRWVGTPPTPAPLTASYGGFDGFLAPSELKIADATRLLVSTEFIGDFDFELAQSASLFEHSCTVSCVHPVAVPAPPPPASPVTPTQDYLHDLVNYNALNVYADGIALNPSSELYPAFSEVTSTNPPQVNQVFHFRYPNSPKGDAGPLATIDPPDGVSPRDFFNAVYDGMTKLRLIRAEAEHTYGQVLSKNFPTDSVSRKADFRVQLPSLKQNSGTKAGQPFLTAEYLPTAGTEQIILTFDTSFLTANVPSDDQTATRSQQSAWRAVAELNHAGQLQILIDTYDFDVLAALDGDGSLVGGLTRIDLNAGPVDVTSQVKALTNRWLQGTFTQGTSESVVVTLAPRMPIARNATVLALSLRVARDADGVPSSNTADWDLRGLPDPGDEPATNSDGFLMPPAPADAALAFKTWLDDLASARMSLPTSSVGDTSYGAVRAALGNPAAAVQASDGSLNHPAWIIPAGPLDPWPGTATVTACPFGFVPVKSSSSLGSQTDVLLRRYLLLLQAVLMLRVPAWSSHTPDDWRALFNQLQSSLDPGTGKLAALLNSLRSLLYPMPNPDNMGLNPDVKQAINALVNGASGQLVKDHVTSLLANDVSIFATAKAFLYVRLRGDSGPLPRDFVDIETTKLIGQSTANPGSGVRSDRMVETYRSMFLDPDAGDPSALALVELLQEPRYDDDFAFSMFRCRRISDLFRRLEDPTAATPADPAYLYTLPSVLQLPGGKWDPVALTPLVWLAAREPVVRPIHLFTVRLDQLATQAGFTTNFKIGARFDYNSLKNGELQPVGSAFPYAEVLFASNAQQRSGKSDIYVLTSAFVVQGAEAIEANTQPDQVFKLDSFYLDLLDKPVPDDPPTGNESPGDATGKLYQRLAAVIEPTTLLSSTAAQPSIPTDVLSDDALSKTASWLAPIPVPKTAPPEVPYAGFKSGTFGISWDTADHPMAEAVILKVVTSATSTTPSFVLLANREAPVWHSAVIGVVQTRNYFTQETADAGHDFAPQFQEVSQEASDYVAYQPVVPVKSTSMVKTLSSRRFTIVSLVQGLLGDLLSGVDPTNGVVDPWKNFDLVVTVNHDQQLTVGGQMFDQSKRTVVPSNLDFAASGFPLQVFRCNAPLAATSNPNIEFPAPYQDFRVDFQWSSSSNMPFFRITDVLVRISD